MRRFVPWVLLGILGLVTGLGLGLGLAFGSTETSPPTSTMRVSAKLRLVPSWLPSGFAAQTSEALIVGFGSGACVSHFVPEQPHNEAYHLANDTYSTADGSQSLEFVTSRCPLSAGGQPHETRVAGRSVSFVISGARGTVWATWKQQPGTYVELVAVNMAEAQTERFIGGLRVAYPSSLHRR